jgi:hypothetical protein
VTRRLIVGCVTLCAVLNVAERSPALAQSAASPADFGLPAESSGWDGVLAGLLSTFDKADVLALGEAHGRQADSDLRVRLIQDPDFAKRVRFIVVEFGTASLQPLIDHYVGVDDVPLKEADQLWMNSQERADFYNAVRGVNRNLPAAARIRVLGVGLPNPSASNASSLTALRNEVLSRHQKALVIYGSGHVWHGHGGITTALDQQMPGRVFVAETLAPLLGIRPSPALDAFNSSLRSFETQIRSTERPVLVSMHGTPAAKLLANPFYLGQAFLPPTTTIGDLDDAVVYFGQ